MFSQSLDGDWGQLFVVNRLKSNGVYHCILRGDGDPLVDVN